MPTHNFGRVPAIVLACAVLAVPIMTTVGAADAEANFCGYLASFGAGPTCMHGVSPLWISAAGAVGLVWLFWPAIASRILKRKATIGTELPVPSRSGTAILNTGRNNTFVDVSFDGFDTAIEDRGEGSRYAGIDITGPAQRHAADITAARIALKARLGEALTSGRALHARSRIVPDGDAAFARDAQKWSDETEAYLSRAVGEGEAHLFTTGSGLTVYSATNLPNANVRSAIDFRLQRLTQLVQRADAVSLNADLAGPLQIKVGEGDGFENNRSNPHEFVRRVGVQLTNLSPAKSLRDCRLFVTAVDPTDQRPVPRSMLEPGVRIDPGTSHLVLLFAFKELGPVGSGSGAESLILFAPNADSLAGHASLIDPNTTIALRATAEDVPFAEATIRVWIQDGKLRIERIA